MCSGYEKTSSVRSNLDIIYITSSIAPLLVTISVLCVRLVRKKVLVGNLSCTFFAKLCKNKLLRHTICHALRFNPAVKMFFFLFLGNFGTFWVTWQERK